MKQQYFKNKNERGIYIVIVSLMLGALIMLGGMAVEVSVLYRTRVRLERAAHAAAVAGVAYRVTQGWWYINGGDPIYGNGNALQPGNHLQDLQDRMREVLINNLLDAGFEGIDVNNTQNPQNLTYNKLEWNSQTDDVTVEITYKQRQLFLPSYIPGIGKVGCDDQLCPVNAKATATLNRANIAMVLDTSGSMLCPGGGASNNNCACRLTPAGCPGAGQRSILQDLQDSVNAFYTYFNPHRDRISIIPFNLGAAPDFISMRRDGALRPFGANPDDLRVFQDRIANLSATSNTNPCDGLITAAQDFRGPGGDAALDPRDNPTVVFFTDGAPNAGRYAFIQASHHIDQTDGRSRLTGSHPVNDWYQYTVEWTSNNNLRYMGPSMLVTCNDNGSPMCDTNTNPANPASPSTSLFNFNVGGTVANPADPYPKPLVGYRANLTYQPNSTPTNIICGSQESTPSDYQKVLNAYSNGTASAPNNTGCLQNNLGFVLPGLEADTQTSNVGEEMRFDEYQARGITDYDYEQLPYHCALRAADYLRTNFGAKVYAIGLGPPPPNCPDPSGLGRADPYQDVSDSSVRKDVFLSRLAFDPEYLRTYVRDGYSFEGRRTTDPDIINNCRDATTGRPHSRSDVNINPTNLYPTNVFRGTFRVGTSGLRPIAQLVTDINNQPNFTPDPDVPINGAYFPANNASQIQEYFTQIAKQILLRQAS